MNKLRLLVVVSLILSSSFIFAQGEKEPEEKLSWYQKGSIYGKIYANYHTSGSDLGKQNAFEVNRAYFGYKTTLNKNFAANVKLDIGASEDLGRRFAFFKNAYLEYKIQKFKVQFGIADAFQFKVQEKFWGYRYIYKSFQDEYRLGSSADIGVFTSYKFTDWVSADFSINNGDGYGKIQNTSTDNLKSTLGVTLTPLDKRLTIRLYGDAMSISSDSTQSTLVGFVGLKLKSFRIGGEYIYQSNYKLQTDYNQSGISAFATFDITDKLNVFARYDHLTSDEIIESEDENGDPILDPNGDPVYESWNSDGDFIMGGIEYKPIKYVNLALNYRYGIPENDSKSNTSWLYFNVQVSF